MARRQYLPVGERTHNRREDGYKTLLLVMPKEGLIAQTKLRSAQSCLLVSPPMATPLKPLKRIINAASESIYLGTAR